MKLDKKTIETFASAAGWEAMSVYHTARGSKATHYEDLPFMIRDELASKACHIMNGLFDRPTFDFRAESIFVDTTRQVATYLGWAEAK
jgi:hypothetical protein